jgi:hypothetical protein
MEVIRSHETPVHTRSTWRHIPEDGIPYSHQLENLKSYDILVISRMCFLQVVKFSFFMGEKFIFTQQLSQVTQYLCGSKLIAVVVFLKDWPSWQSNWRVYC